ncbi:hypothetical protein M407DRAFT_191987 [Tulasnella calospora MUT 4182]|uniref:Uncharacterized protein n=1 Tax=Tulasnella calospora MUT 4182 TaxID=1051891 RepID=A0A0C3QV56_9AGAM|nr:hypothetical protein M407DRAFT_191987 [Tulasnella calospora MUT 4182]
MKQQVGVDQQSSLGRQRRMTVVHLALLFFCALTFLGNIHLFPVLRTRGALFLSPVRLCYELVDTLSGFGFIPPA